MSSVDINLLSENKIDKVKSKRLTQLRRIAFIFIIFVGVFSVISFILNFSSPINSIKKQQNDILSQITLQQAKAAKMNIVTERANSIGSLYQSRASYPDILKSILSNLPPDVSATGLDVGSSSVTISFTSPSLLSLNTLLNNLIEELKKQPSVKSVFLDNLTASADSSSYLMEVRIELE